WRPAPRKSTAPPLPPPNAAVYVSSTAESTVARFVSVSSDVKKELLSPATERTTGTTTVAPPDDEPEAPVPLTPAEEEPPFDEKVTEDDANPATVGVNLTVTA